MNTNNTPASTATVRRLPSVTPSASLCWHLAETLLGTDRNAFLPGHFLLGIAQTSTGVIRPMMVETVSAEIQLVLRPV